MKRKTVSLCLIACDEEAHIGKAVKSALALVDEVVVVDTGSRDNTRIIAEGYGARVIDEVWQDDFASARNAAIAAASCDWVLFLDCDEQLQSTRPVDFQRLLSAPGIAGYRLQITDGVRSRLHESTPAIRLFVNHPDVRYRYPVLEQIEPSLALYSQAEGLVIAATPLVIMHNVGNADARSRKRDRNLRLLHQAAAQYPEEPYFEFQLGRETLQVLDGEVLPVAGLNTGLKHLESAWRRVMAMPPEIQALISFGGALAVDFVSALLAAGQLDRAADTVGIARHRWGGDIVLRLQAARVALARLLADPAPADRSDLVADIEAILAQLEDAADGLSPVDLRAVTLGRQRLIGDLALATGRVSEAAEAYEQALRQDQSYSVAWMGLADCARLAGDRKRALRLYLRAVTASEWNVEAWRRGCRLLDELGFHDNAQSWRARVQENFPELVPSTK